MSNLGDKCSFHSHLSNNIPLLYIEFTTKTCINKCIVNFFHIIINTCSVDIKYILQRYFFLYLNNQKLK